MDILGKLNNSITKLSNEATDLALLKEQLGRDITDIHNKIADIDVRLNQIIGAIKELDTIIKEVNEK